MLCLRCGECCRTMSPLDDGPCRYLSVVGDVATCTIYRGVRPKQCVNHDFPSWSVCPVGRDVLGIHDADSLAAREYVLGYAPWVDGKEEGPCRSS
jgi:hypothetical protein